MKALKRIFKNIHWAIFNHPPTSITLGDNDAVCGYCGGEECLWTDIGRDERRIGTICAECKKKVYSAILMKEQD